MNTHLNIDSDAVVAYTATLERMSKSALPVAVRSALNSTAFDVKKNTMPMESKVFVHRAPTFFKATSKVKPATGFAISEMAAIVGFIPQVSAKEKGGATKDLEQQENSGIIGGRAFVPLAKARAGGSYQRRVKSDLTMTAIKAKGMSDSLKNKRKTRKQKFIASAVFAGKGGFVIGTNRRKGARMLMRINSISRQDGRTVVNSTAVYSVKAHRHVKPKATKFMRKASLLSERKMETFYAIEANKQINKLR